MAPRPKLPPVQVLQRVQRRLEKRMEALQRTKLDGCPTLTKGLARELDIMESYLEMQAEEVRKNLGAPIESHYTESDQHIVGCVVFQRWGSDDGQRLAMHDPFMGGSLSRLYHFPSRFSVLVPAAPWA